MPRLDTTVSEGWLWLGASMLLAIFCSNLVWLFSPWVEADRARGEFGSLAERIVVKVATWRFASASYQILRLLYYVGLPFAALFWGHDAIVSRLFGLQALVLPEAGGTQHSTLLSANWLDWLGDLGWAAALGLGSWGFLLLAAWARRRALSRRKGHGRGSGTSGSGTVQEAVYHEIHWAFYRNAPIVAFGLYWGVWMGLGLVALEALANPMWRKGMSDPTQASGQLLRASLAVVSSLLFLQTQNLWLALVVHSAVSWGLRWGYGASAGRNSTSIAAQS